MAQLRAKQIKLNAVNDILVGGANGNGTVLSMGTDKTVLKVVGTTLQYAQQIAEDVAFSDVSLAGVTDVKGAVLKVATDAAAAVAAEATRATGIEAGLRTDVDAAAAAVVAETTRATGEETRIEGLVTAEVARATAAEGIVTAAVSDEVTRATAAEAALQAAIDALDSANSDAVAAEKTRAEAAELVLTNALAAEVTRATAAEGVLTTDLAKEVTDRTAADAAEVVARDAAIKVADDRAVAAELVLTTAIADEKTRAEAAELVLTTAVSDEKTRAEAAELALGGRIDDLVGLNALHFVGNVNGGSTAEDLAALDAKQGDVYRVTIAGAADFAGTGLDVNVGDFVAKAGDDVWVKFDNTDPAVTGTGNINVAGNAHAGYTVSLTGIVGVANGGTGLAAAGSAHTVLTAKADGSLEYAMVSGLRDEAGLLAVDATSGKLVAVASTVDADVAGTLTTKDYVDAKVAAATAAATAAAAVVLYNEDFAQAADAANASVTVANTPKGDVSVFFNGVKLGKTAYTVVGKVVTLIDSVVGYSVENGDSINVSYMGAMVA